MSVESTTGPCRDARLLGCTCAWLCGYGVGEPAVKWCEVIIWRDPECTIMIQSRRDGSGT